MAALFDPRLDILPAAQREIWPMLSAAPGMSFVLYGGTAIALQLGHRVSVDFDFFCFEPLAKDDIRFAFGLWDDVSILQDDAAAAAPRGSCKAGREASCGRCAPGLL